MTHSVQPGQPLIEVEERRRARAAGDLEDQVVREARTWPAERLDGRFNGSAALKGEDWDGQEHPEDAGDVSPRRSASLTTARTRALWSGASVLSTTTRTRALVSNAIIGAWVPPRWRAPCLRG